MKPYVVRMRNTSVVLVGPFADDAAASEWGARDQDASGDDPRWQLVHLAEPRVPVLASDQEMP